MKIASALLAAQTYIDVWVESEVHLKRETDVWIGNGATGIRVLFSRDKFEPFRTEESLLQLCKPIELFLNSFEACQTATGLFANLNVRSFEEDGLRKAYDRRMAEGAMIVVKSIRKLNTKVQEGIYCHLVLTK